MRQTTPQHLNIHTRDAATWLLWISALALLLTVGCAGQEPVPNAMASAPPPRTASYTLHVEPRVAEVSVTFRRPAVDPLPLKVGTQAQDRIYRLRALRADTGAPLTTVADPKTPGRWLISGAQDNDITVTYLVIDQRPELAPGTPDGPIPPLTTARAFYGQGQHLFIVPDLPADAPPIEGFKVNVTAAPDWPVWTSWGRPSTGLDRAAALWGSLILAGDWKVETRKETGTLIQIATPPTAPVEIASVQAAVERLARSHRGVFGSYPWNSLLLVFAPGATPRAWTAHSAITTLTAPGAPPSEATITDFLSGAHFQLWTQPLNAAQPTQTQWFSEGTPRYYALRTMVELGFVPQEAFVDLINAWITTYYDLMLADSRTPKEEAHMRDLKGRLVSLTIDVELRAESLGLRTLDHLMRKMLLDFGQSPQGYTNDDLLERLNLLSKKTWDTLFSEHLAQAGGPLPMASLDQGGVIVTYTRRELGYALGFEVEGDTFKNATVIAVEEGSEASAAGLRVGDVIQGIAHKADDPKTPVHLVIKRVDVEAPINLTYTPVKVVLLPRVQELGPLLWEWIGP